MNKTLPLLFISSIFISENSYSSQWNRNNSRLNSSSRLTNNQQISNITPQNETESINNKVAILPIDVKNENIKNRIMQNDTSYGVTINDLYACKNVWSDGVFVWDIPNAGQNIPKNDTCSAVITLKDSNTQTVLATAKVAINNTFVCNIDSFPDDSFTPAIQNVIFPADKEPTENDVKNVINAERKNGAGFKTLAAAIVGGIGGNLAVKSDSGNSALSLGEKDGQRSKKILGTIAGATIMGGGMYASTQMDSISGNITENALINAAGGTFLGNIYSGVSDNGKDYIQTKTINGQKYAIGYYNTETSNENTNNNNKTLYFEEYQNNNLSEKFYSCTETSSNYNCTTTKSILKTNNPLNSPICLDLTNYNRTSCSGNYLKQINGIQTDKLKLQPALALISNIDKNGQNATYSAFYHSDNNYSTIGAEYQNDPNKFIVTYKSAAEGGIIDFSNKARTKATVIGGVGGGAIGGFSGYQFAQQELSDRYTSEVQTYRDSLKKFYCASGNHILGFYNEPIILPAITNIPK